MSSPTDPQAHRRAVAAAELGASDPAAAAREAGREAARAGIPRRDFAELATPAALAAFDVERARAR